MTQYLQFAIDMAKYANEVILTNFNQPKNIEIKSDMSPVTSIDISINNKLIGESLIHFPDFSVVGEEASSSGSDTEFAWVCDPIDGTIPFIIGMPTSTFSLALCRSGVPIVGVISHPLSGQIVKAELGLGASDVNNRPIKVNSKLLDDSLSIINIDWWSKSEFDFSKVYNNLTQKERAYIITPGSACYAALMVATGKFTASVFAGTAGKCMDMAAASLIVKEAGGIVTDFQGNDQRYDRDLNGCVLSNGLVHSTILQYMPSLQR